VLDHPYVKADLSASLEQTNELSIWLSFGKFTGKSRVALFPDTVHVYRKQVNIIFFLKPDVVSYSVVSSLRIFHYSL